VAGTRVPPELLERLYAQVVAGRWRPARATFVSALDTAVARRFGDAAPAEDEVRAFLASLHLADVALACMCREGDEQAWESLINEHRPPLRAAARAMARDGSAEELADSLFADLYSAGAGSGTPLLAYYHGRARLGSWLRTVLAQRYVDRYRAGRRTVPLESAGEVAVPAEQTTRDPHHHDYVLMVQRALDEAIDHLPGDDRLRLRLYYGGSMTLAQIGKLVGEHETTVSRKLERARRQLRQEVDRRLTDQGLSPAAVKAAFDAASSAASLHASRLLAEEGE
jgi:RNA polymerase sigma-70 factor